VALFKEEQAQLIILSSKRQTQMLEMASTLFSAPLRWTEILLPPKVQQLLLMLHLLLKN
jgi:hypothetical protein